MNQLHPHAEDERPTVPVCPLCGGMMRRGARWGAGKLGPLVCDLHGAEKPRWETIEETEAE